MDKKIEEMIALGAAYAVNCQPCMEVHKRLAIEAGLTKEEMLEAIQVAEAIKTGAYGKAKQSADSLFGQVKEGRCCPVASECCPEA
jgi:AhpD family alkylhydroperoxidase